MRVKARGCSARRSPLTTTSSPVTSWRCWRRIPITSMPQQPPSAASSVSTGLAPSGSGALSIAKPVPFPVSASKTRPDPDPGSTPRSTTRTLFAIRPSPDRCAGPGGRSLDGAGDPLAGLRLRFPRPIAARRSQRQVQLLVREHLAPAHDLRRIVLEHEMGQVVEPHLDLLAEAHHGDEVIAGPHQPREAARERDAEEI